MMKLDPIIAVRDMEASCRWYKDLLGCECQGEHIKNLIDESNQVLLCLHVWEEDDHPTMKDFSITPGNGLILYFRVPDLGAIRENAKRLKARIDEEIHTNPNSRVREFSLWDLDGYYLIITEYHDYGR